MKISIIGCGWLGLPLGAFLVQKNYVVKGSTRTESKLEIIRSKGIEPFLIDLKSIIDHQNHSNHLDNLDDFFDTDLLYINIPPTRSNPNIENDYPKWIKFLIQKCETFGIQKVIFVSSTGVYPNTESIVTEDTSPNPQTASQRAIIQAEKLLISNKNFKTTILRPSGLVGGNRIAGRWFAGKQNVSGGNIPVNLVHLDDCIGVSHEIIRQNMFGEVLNLCADEHPIKSEFYTAQAEKYGFEKPSFQMEIPQNFKIVDNQKSKQLLNYQYLKPSPMDF
jgi:nucleoside-diphosphate-sugar epimerase